MRAASARYLAFLSALEDRSGGSVNLERITEPHRSYRGFNFFAAGDLAVLLAILRGEQLRDESGVALCLPPQSKMLARAFAIRRTMFKTSSVQPRWVTEISFNGLTRLNFSRTSSGVAMIVCVGQASRLVTPNTVKAEGFEKCI
jgi:hypothetical protein